MASKTIELNQPVPSYEEVVSQQSGNYSHFPTEQASRPAPVFITARTSVYGPVPVEMDCPHCQVHIVTHIDRIAGLLPWCIFGACVILGFFLFLIPWCFCCLPFFTDQCLDVLHSCPACRTHLGRYSRM